MRALRYVSLLLLASCGGFLPFFGSDDDDAPNAPPPPPVSAEGSSDPPADGSTSANDSGLSVVDGGLSQDDATINGCKNPPGKCSTTTSCCAGSICGADASCCVPGGLYANAKDQCCDGDGVFEGFPGWKCLDVR